MRPASLSSRLWLPVLLLLLVGQACRPSEKEPAGSDTDQATRIADSALPGPLSRSVTRQECPRATPEPILSSKMYPRCSFALSADSMFGYERAALEGGDSLTILHSGCEYVVTAFHFVVEAPTDTTSRPEVYGQAVLLMEKVLPAIEERAFFKEGLDTLSHRLGAGLLNIGQEYEFGDPERSGMNQAVTVSEARGLPNGKFRVSVGFSIGPL